MIMIIIYISQRAWEAIKPRQIINYTGIVLIDLHQQRKNNFRQYKSATLNTGQPHVNEEQNPQNNNPQHPLSNQMIEQINIALEQKGSGNFSAWVIEACRRETNVRKEGIYIN